jgi:hypothetical protein
MNIVIIVALCVIGATALCGILHWVFDQLDLDILSTLFGIFFLIGMILSVVCIISLCIYGIVFMLSLVIISAL